MLAIFGIIAVSAVLGHGMAQTTFSPTTGDLPEVTTFPTTPEEVTTPEETTTTKAPIINECSARGNTFRVVPDTNCKIYTIEAIGTPATQALCPPKLSFDIEKCTCNYENDVKCGFGALLSQATTPQVTTPAPVPTTPAPVEGTTPDLINYECKANGNTFRVLPESRCKKYTISALGGPAQELVCPPKTRFDTNKCTCNWEQDMKCPGYDDCYSFGNLFVVLPSTDCRNYTIESYNTKPQELACPPTTKFDTIECTCNYEDKVYCNNPFKGIIG